MSASFGTSAQLQATVSIPNSTILIVGVWVKLPADVSAYGSTANGMKLEATQSIFFQVRDTEDIRARAIYGSGAVSPTAFAIPTTAWRLVIIAMDEFTPLTSKTIAAGISGLDTTYSDLTSASIGHGATGDTFTTVTFGSTSGSADIPGTKLAEGFVISAASTGNRDTIVAELLGGSIKPDEVSVGSVLWYRDMLENGTAGTGSGDLSASGTITYDAEDHPYAAAPPGGSYVPRVMIY